MVDTMKIAAVTDDGETISRHFGRAQQFVVVTVDDGKIINREVRSKTGHHNTHGRVQVAGEEDQHQHSDHQEHGKGHLSPKGHRPMFVAISDCEVILARGMGYGAYQGAQQSGLRPIITDIAEIDAAVQAAIDGTIIDHTEKLH